MVLRCWLIAAIVIGVGAGGCFSPQFEDAALMCGPNQLCPPGLACGDDNRCHSEGAKKDAGGDLTKPAAPSLTALTPTSPANNNNPTVTGTAEVGTTVTIYSDSACTTELASGTAAALASPGISIPVADNTTISIAATATDEAGNKSNCSTALMFIEDSAAPAVPAITSTIPASPSRSVIPSVHGTAEIGTTVLLYANASCSGMAAGMGTADAAGAFAVATTVAPSVVTAITAVARDAAGNVSACSSMLNYQQNASAVGVPTLGATVPASPSNTITNPMVTGTAEAGVTVRLYSNPSCSGTPLATGTADVDSTYAIAVTVSPNTTTTYYVQAFDSAVSMSSLCSAASLTYQHDSQAPPAPFIASSLPLSPSNSQTPTIGGSAEPSAVVQLYSDAACTTAAGPTGVTAITGAFSIQVPTTADTTFYAKATDPAGNTSICSSTSIAYDYDAVPPGMPVFTASTPTTPSTTNNTPLINGTAESNTTVRLYRSADCSGAEASSGGTASGTNWGVLVTVPSNSVTPLSATATDLAGNTSSCTLLLTYVHDSLVPAAPVITSTNPGSPANGNSPMIMGTAEMGSTVSLYTNSGCTTQIGSSQLATTGTFSIPVSVVDNTATILYTKAVDSATNPSACSSATFTYTEDSAAPAAPTLNALPASNTNTTPMLTGSSEAGATINIYATNNCSGSATLTTTATGGTFAVMATVTANSQTPFSAKAVDSAGNASACSTSFTYVHDNVMPGPPTGLASSPTSPSGSNNPNISGNAEALSTVRLFTNPTCSTAVAGTITATAGGAFAIPLTVGTGSTTTFYATTTDPAGNGSMCSTASVTYTEDSVAPAAPTNLSSNPLSPASNMAPMVTGTAEAGSTVKLYGNAACSGSVLFSGAAGGANTFSIAVTVNGNATTNFWATATDTASNTSPCSTSSLAYLHDNGIPNAPVITASSPASPANATNPSILGTAEASSTVKIYTTSDCTGTVLAAGPATGGNFTIPVVVGGNVQTNLYASATDSASNVSACSAIFSYTDDSSPPGIPMSLATTPNLAANNNNAPSLGGTTTEAGATITVYTAALCVGPVAGSATSTSGGAFTVPLTVANNSTTTFYAKATDAAGNSSNCTASGVAYIEDSDAPSTPVVTTTNPTPPSNNNNPQVQGTGDTGSTVKIYTTSNCTGTVFGTGTVAAGTFAITLTTALTANLQSTLYASASDAANNTSGCSAGITYLEDSVAPDFPTALATNPISNSNANSPSITGSSEANAIVRAYSDATCSTLAGTATANGAGSFSIQVTVLDNSSNTFYVRASDAATNASTCSATASIGYTENSTATETPVLTGTNPVSPSNGTTTPLVLGNSQNGYTINLYTNATCTSAVVGTGTVTGTTFSITATGAANTTTTFYAKATSGGNPSGCSAGIPYTQDGNAPVAPTGLATIPPSPSNVNTPTVTGTAEAGATINIYTNSNCTAGNVGTGTATGGSFSIVTASLSSDALTTLYVKATDAANNSSPCASIAYTEDSTQPAAPTVTATNPVSPSNSNTAPTVSGAAEALSTVKIYSGTCTPGSAIATTTATAGATYSVGVTVSANSTTTFRAQATDAAGNVSACSTVNQAYTHDNQAPATPTGFAISPVGPANNNSPNATGSAEAGSTVTIYPNATCTAPSTATGTATGGTFTIALSVTNNTNNTFSAKATDAAGNPSGCTGGVAYVEDSNAPTAPTFTVSTPASPSNSSTTPLIKGNAEANSTVTLFTNISCTAPAAYTGTANAAGTFSISVTVTANTSVTYYAKATDAATNASVCSSGANGSYTYTHDSSNPALPVMTGINPNSPANENAPVLSGTAEAGVTVYVYTATPCTSPVAQGVATGGNYAIPVSVGDNTTNSLYVKATDAANNSSACSSTPLTYVEDSDAPLAPSISDLNPKSPSNSNVVAVTGNTSEDATIKFYSNKFCSSAVLGTGTAEIDGKFTINATVPSDTATSIFATATDAAGNVSDCAGGVDYVEDSTQPVTPTGLGSSPTSPANNNAPSITGTAEFDTLVTVFTASNCTGTSFSATSISATFAVPVSIADNTQVTYYANSTDAAGNVSGCSAGFAFREDSAVAAPVITGSTPTSPSTSNSAPTINGTAEASGTVKLYNGNSCAGASIAQTTAGAGGTFTVSVTLSPNAVNVLTATVTDLANNTSVCSSPFVYIHDNTQPTMPATSMMLALTAVATAQDKVLVSWASGSDNITLAANLRYDVCWTTVNGGACTSSATTVAPATSYLVTGLSSSVRYYFYVRPVDNAGNAGVYRGPVSERTWGLGTITQISAGYQSSCALIGDGTVKCWGQNADGELGDNSQTTRTSPVAVTGLVDVTQIAVGGSGYAAHSHACALKVNGTVWCWGSNSYGQLGDASNTDRKIPVQVSGITNAIRITAGGLHTCALINTGAVQCWGFGTFGQLGTVTAANSNVPVSVSSVTNAVQVDAGLFHTCALIADGTARCWGKGDNGRLGQGTTASSNTAVTVAFTAGDKAKAIDVGNNHSCALLTSGQMRCWGANTTGQLGTNNTTDASSPVAVTTNGSSALTNIVSLSAGGSFLSSLTNTYGTTCAGLASGGAACWGYNPSGQIGNGTTTQQLVPYFVSGSANVTQVSVGQDHTCFLNVNGTAKCVGNGGTYRLGNGGTTNISTAVAVANLYGPERGVQIRASNGGYNSVGNTTCSLISDGEIKCWGLGQVGQNGDGGGANNLTPGVNPVVDAGDAWILAKQISVGERHACAVTGGGLVWCWGKNNVGQLGDNSLVDRLIAVQITTLSNIVSVSAGQVHTCALDANGQVFCWGDNTYSQIGKGSAGGAAVQVPTMTLGISGVAKMVAHGFGGCGILGDGTMKCWGWNGYGGLGDNTTTDRSSAVAVMNVTNAIDISSNRWGLCTLIAGGTAKCQGYGYDGQMGNNTPGASYNQLPVSVTGSNFVQLAGGGEQHTCGRLATGALQCWGLNSGYQLGLNDTTARAVPTTLSSIATVKDIGLGWQHTCALIGDGTAYCWGSAAGGSLGDNTNGPHTVGVPGPVIYFP